MNSRFLAIPRRNWRILLTLALVLLMASAAAPAFHLRAAAAPGVDLRVDTNKDGRVDVRGDTDERDEDRPGLAGDALVLPNLDDDSGRCREAVARLIATPYTEEQLDDCHDAADEIVNGNADVLDLSPIRLIADPQAPAGARLDLTLSPAGRVRLFILRDGEYLPVDRSP